MAAYHWGAEPVPQQVDCGGTVHRSRRWDINQSRQGKAAEVNVVGMEALMMEKYITDERTGLKYELVGDYY